MRGKRNESHGVRFIGHQRLEECYVRGKGTKKHLDKHGNPEALKDKLYMDTTTNQYHRHWDDFCDSMKRAGYKVSGHAPRTLEEARGYMPQYLEELKARPGAKPGTNFSAWSVRAYFAASAKVLGLSASDYALPTRHRADISRSRGTAARDRNFSEDRNSDLVDFCRCTGLRNHKELQQIKGTDLISRSDGSYAIKVYGKGGRVREAPVFGSPAEVKAVVERMRGVGEARVWSSVPSCMDIHGYRAQYACRIYKAYARPPEVVPPSERYYCRGDLKGYCFDRRAMQMASEALGHSRLNVIASHYLYKLVEDDI